MPGRVAAVLTLATALAVWNGVFDRSVSRGAQAYLEAQAEFMLGRGPEPSMRRVMEAARRQGALVASVWALLAAGGGWAAARIGRGRAGEAR